MRLWKRYTWLGGVRTPLIVHWPRRHRPTAARCRSQFCHAIDLMPTICDADRHRRPRAGRRRRRSYRSTASSLLPTFTDAGAPDARAHAVLRDARLTGDLPRRVEGDDRPHRQAAHRRAASRSRAATTSTRTTGRCSTCATDFSEATDVAAEHPDRVARMEALWWAEAGRNQVLPLEDSFLGRAVAIEPSPEPPPPPHDLPARRGRHRRGRAPADGRRLRLAADVVRSRARRAASSAALGDWVQRVGVVPARRPAGHRLQPVRAHDPPRRLGSRLTAGDHELGLTYEGGRLIAGGRRGRGRPRVLPGHLPFRWQIGGGQLLIGRDAGLPGVRRLRAAVPVQRRPAHGHRRDPDVRPRDPRPRSPPPCGASDPTSVLSAERAPLVACGTQNRSLPF